MSPKKKSDPVPKDQIQLECHLCVFIHALKRQKQTKQIRKDLATLRESIEVMRRHSDLAFPPQRWQKKGIVALLTEEATPLSIDEILEWASSSGLMLGRRRLHIRLSKLKRDGIVTNPKRGFWTITDRAEEEFLQDTAADWNTENFSRRRTRNGRFEYYCSRCTEYYPETSFYKNKRGPYGLQYYCKVCHDKYQKPASLVERTDS